MGAGGARVAGLGGRLLLLTLRPEEDVFTKSAVTRGISSQGLGSRLSNPHH